MTANEIIEAFGGVRPMHRLTGIPITTIQSWQVRGDIAGAKTVAHQRAILRAAKKAKLKIKAKDLIGEDVA